MTVAADPAPATGVDESWPIIEEAVFRLFDEAAATDGGYTVIGPLLSDLGWSDIEAEYPTEACELLFRAQGRSLAQTDCLDRVMLAELTALIDGDADGVVLPGLAEGPAPSSDGSKVTGIVFGPLGQGGSGRLVVPVLGPTGGVSIGVVAADLLSGTTLDTFDKSITLTQVSGPLEGPLVDASTGWARALAAAQRALATELVALADEALRAAVQHASVRNQFGVPIGSFQAPRHLLADAAASIEGARSLLSLSWRYGGGLSARTAKAAAGRAHRASSDAAMQVCGAIGLTAEHRLHRYVSRGFQLDALCGSSSRLEAVLAEGLFDVHAPGGPLPGVTSWD